MCNVLCSCMFKALSMIYIRIDCEIPNNMIRKQLQTNIDICLSTVYFIFNITLFEVVNECYACN